MFRKHNVASLIYCCLDSISRMSTLRQVSTTRFLSRYKRFDTVYHYDPQEAKKFGFTYYPLVLQKLEHNQSEPKEPKVFFCGLPKGRIETLKRVANYLEKNNIKYEFLLQAKPPTDESERKQYKGIHFFSDFLPYEEMIRKAQSATCLLSLLPEQASMATSAFTEAILYNKKLLTDYPFLESHPFYNKKYMKHFSNIYDIDPNFIRSMKKVNYNYKDEFSVENFLQRVEQDHTFLRRKVKIMRRRMRFIEKVITFIKKKTSSFFINKK